MEREHLGSVTVVVIIAGVAGVEGYVVLQETGGEEAECGWQQGGSTWGGGWGWGCQRIIVVPH